MLEPGTPFPPLDLPRAGGGRLRLPADLSDRWGVVIVYRGHW